MGDVTTVLEAMQRGEPKAAEALLSVVYGEMLAMARQKMAQEPQGHTLQPTILVHDVWLKLFPEGQHPAFVNRAHFFAAAGEVMRRLLVDHARRRRSLKRGGAAVRVAWQESQIAAIAHPAPTEEMLAVDEVLDKLKAQDELCANLVNLRYFVCMTMEETAAALGLSKRETERLWTYCRAWLRKEMGKGLAAASEFNAKAWRGEVAKE
jgi:RNA polymerase sigma factor (TIGR02999 family)